MQTATKKIAAYVRTGTGKGAARAARRNNRIPAVIYGGGGAPEPIELDFKSTNQLIYAGHFLTTIFEIEVGGRVQKVIPRDYQLHVVTGQPLHVDFLRVISGGTVRVHVPVHILHQEVCKGLKKGGVINFVHHTLDMRVPPDAIPEAIQVDIAHLDVHESIHLSDLTLPDGCKPVLGTEKDFTILTIMPPTLKEEVEESTSTEAVAESETSASLASTAKK